MAETLMIASAGVNVAASLFGADAAADAMERQAEIAAWQGLIAKQNAEFSMRMQLRAGREQATELRRRSRREVSGAVASVGASGVELAGSPLVAVGEKIRRDELSAARVITNARARAFSEEAAGRAAVVTAQARASALREQADVTRVTGFLRALGAGLNAGGTYQLMTRGAGPSGGGSFDPYESGDFDLIDF